VPPHYSTPSVPYRTIVPERVKLKTLTATAINATSGLRTSTFRFIALSSPVRDVATKVCVYEASMQRLNAEHREGPVLRERLHEASCSNNPPKLARLAVSCPPRVGQQFIVIGVGALL